MVDEIIGGIASSRIITSWIRLEALGNGVYLTNNEIIIAKNMETKSSGETLNITKIFFGIISIIFGIPVATFLFPNNRLLTIITVLIFLWISLAISGRIVKPIIDKNIYPSSEIEKRKLDEIPLIDVKNIVVFHGFGVNPAQRPGIINIILNDNSEKKIVVTPYPDDGEFAYLSELFEKTLPEKIIKKLE